MKTVKKGSVSKKIDNEKLLADYLLAGWKVVETPKVTMKNKDILKDEEL